MAMVLNNGICQCCSSEGTFKNVKSKYHWMGEEEVYADMLNECFNITLYVEGCEDSGICELCITQLRNAVNFKKLVLHTQQQFLKAINDKTLQVIKIEKLKSDEEMEDSSDHFADDDDLGDSDFVPELKEEKAEEESETKNRVRSTASKSKVNNPAEKKTTVKRPGKKITVKPDEETKLSMRNLKDYEKDKCNLRSILSHSNASPVAHKSTDGYSCSVCPEKFNEPANLKQHFLEEHNTEKAILHVIRKISDRAIKLDITKLCCSLCNRNLSDLEDLIKHLKNEHNKDMYTDIKSHIIPLKFDSPVLRCAICMEEYHTFHQLIEHMNVHYNNYVCETCNACFVTEPRFRCHLKVHEAGAYKCEQCNKVFRNPTKRTYHFRKMHLGIRKRQACTLLKGRAEVKVLKKKERVKVTNKVKKEYKLTEELKKHLHNAKQIMKHTNATPIGRDEGIGFACCFCDILYPDAGDLKEHTIKNHDLETDWRKYKFVKRMANYLLKLDVTSLECKICNNEIDSFDNLIDHLEKNHDLFFYKDIKNQIIPFQFGGDLFQCIACPTVFNRFKALLEHMCSHYGNYICEICGRRCINKRKYGSHKGTHVFGEFPCDSCSKIFNTIKKKKVHEQRVHLGVCSHKCAYCQQKFPDNDKKLIHLKAIHGVQYNSLTCQSCGKEYRQKKLLTEHIRRNHLMERSHGCQYCEKTFFTQNELKNHLYKHSKNKDFICELCSKCFASKKRLSQHIRIHSTERRFKCFHCEFASLHRSSWRHHMQTKHNATV